MATARVTGSGVRLRETAGGTIVQELTPGQTLQTFETVNGWTRVAFGDGVAARHGWVSAQFLAQGVAAATVSAPAAPGPPMPDDEDHPVTVADGWAVTPDGRRFAKQQTAGFYTSGRTALRDWLSTSPAGAGLTASQIRAVRAVSINEGRLEAVNSYDNCYLSFGIFQWTAGKKDEAGELAALIARLKASHPAAYQDCFGRYGLDTAAPAGSVTGYLMLKGTALNGPLAKQQLRGAAWAYRFWRAGHHPDVRDASLTHAAGRIARFINVAVEGHRLGEWLTSEYGVALALDQHVNRPGYVVDSVARAVQAVRKAGLTTPPAAWTTADEAQLIRAFIVARNATAMTDPAKRAAEIAGCVHDGVLSDVRGSFAG